MGLPLVAELPAFTTGAAGTAEMVYSGENTRNHEKVSVTLWLHVSHIVPFTITFESGENT